jgi:hypothetical protein
MLKAGWNGVEPVDGPIRQSRAGLVAQLLIAIFWRTEMDSGRPPVMGK